MEGAEKRMKIKELFVGQTDHIGVQFFRYLFVGGFSFVADFSVMTLLTECFGIYFVVSATISFLVGLAVNYLLSTFWIFKNSKIKNKLAEFLGFALIGGAGLVLNDLIIAFFQHVLGAAGVFGPLWEADKYYMLGKLVSTAVVFLWNFFARKYLLFNKKSSEDTSSEDTSLEDTGAEV